MRFVHPEKERTVALPTFKNVPVTAMTDCRVKGRISLLEGTLGNFPHATFRTAMWSVLPSIGSALAGFLTRDKTAGFIK